MQTDLEWACFQFSLVCILSLGNKPYYYYYYRILSNSVWGWFIYPFWQIWQHQPLRICVRVPGCVHQEKEVGPSSYAWSSLLTLWHVVQEEDEPSWLVFYDSLSEKSLFWKLIKKKLSHLHLQLQLWILIPICVWSF